MAEDDLPESFDTRDINRILGQLPPEGRTNPLAPMEGGRPTLAPQPTAYERALNPPQPRVDPTAPEWLQSFGRFKLDPANEKFFTALGMLGGPSQAMFFGPSSAKFQLSVGRPELAQAMRKATGLEKQGAGPAEIWHETGRDLRNTIYTGLTKDYGTGRWRAEASFVEPYEQIVEAVKSGERPPLLRRLVGDVPPLMPIHQEGLSGPFFNFPVLSGAYHPSTFRNTMFDLGLARPDERHIGTAYIKWPEIDPSKGPLPSNAVPLNAGRYIVPEHAKVEVRGHQPERIARSVAHELGHMGAVEDRFAPGANVAEMLRWHQDQKKVMDAFKATENRDPTAHEKYWLHYPLYVRTPGEYAANEAGARAHMTLKELRETPPHLTTVRDAHGDVVPLGQLTPHPSPHTFDYRPAKVGDQHRTIRNILQDLDLAWPGSVSEQGYIDVPTRLPPEPRK